MENYKTDQWIYLVVTKDYKLEIAWDFSMFQRKHKEDNYKSDK